MWRNPPKHVWPRAKADERTGPSFGVLSRIRTEGFLYGSAGLTGHAEESRKPRPPSRTPTVSDGLRLRRTPAFLHGVFVPDCLSLRGQPEHFSDGLDCGQARGDGHGFCDHREGVVERPGGAGLEGWDLWLEVGA